MSIEHFRISKNSNLLYQLDYLEKKKNYYSKLTKNESKFSFFLKLLAKPFDH